MFITMQIGLILWHVIELCAHHYSPAGLQFCLVHSFPPSAHVGCSSLTLPMCSETPWEAYECPGDGQAAYRHPQMASCLAQPGFVAHGCLVEAV